MPTTKSKAESGSATRQRLLEAAEELFSERGFDSVSVRDITDRAGANVASVNYHFKGREHLVDLVVERYISPINEERVARLDALEGKVGRKPVALEELLEAFVRPFVTQVRKSDLSEKMFFKLMGRCLGERGEQMMPESIEQEFQQMLMRFKKAFAKSLPELDEEELLWRMHFMVGAMIHTMAHAETLSRFTRGASGNPSMERILSRFIRFSSAGLRQESKGEEPKAKGAQDEFEF